MDLIHVAPWSAAWIAERVVASGIIFAGAWTLKCCFNGLRANQRLALGDGVEMRGAWFRGAAHERRALLLPLSNTRR